MTAEKLVVNNLDLYRSTYPTSADSAYWAGWEFNNAIGQTGQTYIGRGIASNYVVLTGPYVGLRGYVSTYTLVSDARQVNRHPGCRRRGDGTSGLGAHPHLSVCVVLPPAIWKSVAASHSL